MSTATLACVEGLPALLLIEPSMTHSVRAAQLSRQRFCVTQTDCALDIFLLQHDFQFGVAVLSDEVGNPFLCSAAENIRRQWPLARILILGLVPAAMNDQLYDDTASHSLDEKALLLTIDRLTEVRWKQSRPHAFPQTAQSHAARTLDLRESDPTKTSSPTTRDLPERDVPSDQHRSHRRGHYAFPPLS